MKIKTKIALVSFGRSHWLKMPRLGLVILTNKINSLPEYYCEYFDYEDIPIYSVQGDHLSIIHYTMLEEKYYVPIIADLPLLDILVQYIKEIKTEELTVEHFKKAFLGDSKKLSFVLGWCKKYGHNPYYFVEMMERIFKRLPSIVKDLEGYTYIGLHNTLSTFFGTLLLSEILRHKYGKKTIGGGPQMTACFANMQKLVDKGLFYDFIVNGDAEHYIDQILNEFISGNSNSFNPYAGKKFEQVDQLENFDFNYDCVLDKGYFYHHFVYDISRGCPFNCKYCGEYTVHGHLALRDPIWAADHLVKLTERYQDLENFVPIWRLGDSLINFDNDHLNLFLDRLIERKKASKSLYVKAMRFYGYARGNISYDLAKKLWDAGCMQLWVGVESFNNDLLKLYNKQLTIERSTESILNLLKNHITVGILLMTNYPTINRIPEDHVYKEILGVKKLAKTIIDEVDFLRIDSGPLKYDQKVFVAAHSMMFLFPCAGYNSMFPVSPWEPSDFFSGKNPYGDLPRNFVIPESMAETCMNYYHKDQILRKIFPINKDSNLNRIDEILEFASIGKMYGQLEPFANNITQTPDYFTLRNDEEVPIGALHKTVRTYLENKARQVLK